MGEETGAMFDGDGKEIETGAEEGWIEVRRGDQSAEEVNIFGPGDEELDGGDGHCGRGFSGSSNGSPTKGEQLLSGSASWLSSASQRSNRCMASGSA